MVHANVTRRLCLGRFMSRKSAAATPVHFSRDFSEILGKKPAAKVTVLACPPRTIATPSLLVKKIYSCPLKHTIVSSFFTRLIYLSFFLSLASELTGSDASALEETHCRLQAAARTAAPDLARSCLPRQEKSNISCPHPPLRSPPATTTLAALLPCDWPVLSSPWHRVPYHGARRGPRASPSCG